MTIKELAYSAQQHLQVGTGGSFKRAHIYELLAASFGFKSHAAFSADTVLTELRQSDRRVAPQSALIKQRCTELGYQPETAILVTSALESFLTERQIGAASISSLSARPIWGLYSQDAKLEYHEDEFEYDENALEDEDEDDETKLFDLADDAYGPLLLDGLAIAASKGNAQAHYALALMHAPDDEDDPGTAGSSYWYSQGLQGHVLTGVEKEWAEAHATRLAHAEKYAHHLREAGRLGNQDALLDLADRFDDPSFFEHACQGIDADPAEIAAIAKRMGRASDAKHWLTLVAESGDTNAMLQLIEEYEHTDLEQCWKWVYLSQLVGTDLSQDAYYAINDDGTAYDDDVGGPAYVGGRGGVDLEPLAPAQDTAARRAAQKQFAQIRLIHS